MKHGFTLIELLIVIAIIGILSTIVAVTFPNYTKRARDAERKTELKQYQVALETYANQNYSVYPIHSTVVNLSGMCEVLGSTGCPDDFAFSYKYLSDATGLNYTVYAKLEKPNTAGMVYWIACSNGKTGESVLVPDVTCSSI